jgi:hypothetical protein
MHTTETETNTDTLYRKTTLAEWKSRLPIGSVNGDKLDQTLSLLPYKGKQERELAKLRRGFTTGGAYANAVLKLLVSRFGEHDFSELSDKEKELVLHDAHLADVLYAYLYVRREAVGNEMDFFYDCPKCKAKQVRTVADLDTLGVNVVEKLDVLDWELRLRDGIPIFGEVRKVFRMGATKWGPYVKETATRKADDVLRSVLLLQATLTEVPGLEAPPVITDSDADETSYYDLQLIETQIGLHTPGAEFALETECPRCGVTILHPVEWNSANFFSIASPSLQKRS